MAFSVNESNSQTRLIQEKHKSAPGHSFEFPSKCFKASIKTIRLSRSKDLQSSFLVSFASKLVLFIFKAFVAVDSKLKIFHVPKAFDISIALFLKGATSVFTYSKPKHKIERSCSSFPNKECKTFQGVFYLLEVRASFLNRTKDAIVDWIRFSKPMLFAFIVFSTFIWSVFGKLFPVSNCLLESWMKTKDESF